MTLNTYMYIYCLMFTFRERERKRLKNTQNVYFYFYYCCHYSIYLLILVHLTLCRHCYINRFMMQQNQGCSQD